MDGRVNKRVDKLITLLLRLEEDLFFGRQQKELTWRPNRRLNEERERHGRAQQIKAADIEVSLVQDFLCMVMRWCLIN